MNDLPALPPLRTTAPVSSPAHPLTPAGAVAVVPVVPDDLILLSAEGLASAGAVSIRTVREWIGSGDLPVVRIGRNTRVRLSDWRRFLAAKSAS